MDVSDPLVAHIGLSTPNVLMDATAPDEEYILLPVGGRGPAVSTYVCTHLFSSRARGAWLEWKKRANRKNNMGQHILRGHDGRYFVRIGWDSIYRTFFLQVADTQSGEHAEEDAEDREPFLWLGQITQPAITSLEPILEAAAPYVTISPALQEQLRREQAEDLAQGDRRHGHSTLDLYYEYQLVTGAQELFIARRYDEALAVLEKVLANNPEAVVAVAMKAGIEAELGQQAGAQKEEHTRRAIDLYGQAIALAYAQDYAHITPRLRTGLGRAHAEAGQIEEALTLYDQALHDIAQGVVLDATDEALASEAKADLLLYRKHDPLGAIPWYERAAQLAPENEVVQYNLGLSQLMVRKPGNASDR